MALKLTNVYKIFVNIHMPQFIYKQLNCGMAEFFMIANLSVIARIYNSHANSE